MSDYGNKLVQAIKKIEVLTRELDRANGFHESAAGKLFDSEEENKQLRARVAELEVSLRNIVDPQSPCGPYVDKLLNRKPRQSLLIHDADVLDRADRAIFEQQASSVQMCQDIIRDLAKPLRQQAKENKS